MSYRREDASGYAGRLYDRLVERFDADRLFIDIDAIRPGTDFAEVIDDALEECDVVLALVGPTWLRSSDKKRRRRLDNPDDFVRLELETALRRGITVIPVLLQGAAMPSRQDLPGSLSAFARRQAFDLSDRRWQTDVRELVEELERLERDRSDRAKRQSPGGDASAEATALSAVEPPPAPRASPVHEGLAGTEQIPKQFAAESGHGAANPDGVFASESPWSPRFGSPSSDAPDHTTTDTDVLPVLSDVGRWRRLVLRGRAGRVIALSAAVVALAAVLATVVLTSRRPTHLVPDVKGKPSSEAQAILRALKFEPRLRHEFNELDAERVVAQSPVTGRLREGQTVTLVVSRGPEIVDVPDLSRSNEQDAINLLVNNGLRPGVINRREDPQAAGRVIEWSLKGSRQPKGTAIDLTISSGGATPPPSPSPPQLLALGSVTGGRYASGPFLPNAILTLKDGWVVDEVGPDRVLLHRLDRPTNKLSLLRVHRVYNPNSPNNEQQELSTTDDALNSVQDVRDLPNGLAAFLSSHPRRVSGLGGVSPTVRAGRNGNQVDGQFRPYDYQGCGTSTNKCVPLFQLSSEPGKTSALALTGSEVARFEVFDVVSGAKLVIVSSALENDFKSFVSDSTDLLRVEQIEFTDRISTVLLRSSVNPSGAGDLVTLTAEVAVPCRTGRVVFTSIASTDRTPLGWSDVLNGKAAVDVTFDGRGLARVVAEYEGSDCARGVSAPLFQRVR